MRSDERVESKTRRHSRRLVGESGYELWLKDPLTFGNQIFRLVPQKSRPRWAARILDACCGQVREIPTPLRRVTQIGNSPRVWRWRHAHAAFNAVRRLTLKAERGEINEPQDFLLYVAENTAKVIYNASDPIDPFDDDAGAWLVSTARDFGRSIDDNRFDRWLWRIIVSEANWH